MPSRLSFCASSNAWPHVFEALDILRSSWPSRMLWYRLDFVALAIHFLCLWMVYRPTLRSLRFLLLIIGHFGQLKLHSVDQEYLFSTYHLLIFGRPVGFKTDWQSWKWKLALCNPPCLCKIIAILSAWSKSCLWEVDTHLSSSLAHPSILCACMVSQLHWTSTGLPTPAVHSRLDLDSSYDGFVLTLRISSLSPEILVASNTCSTDKRSTTFQFK